MILLALLVACSTKASPDSEEEDTGSDNTPIHIAGSGIPYGYWGLNGSDNPEGYADLKDNFGMTTYMVTSSNPSWTVSTLLPAVRDAGLTVNLHMTSFHPADDDGNFSLEEWKAELDTWTNSSELEDIQEELRGYIDSGILAGHMLLDDIDTFQGNDPTAEELDEMARYSQELFPGLMTFIREDADRMPLPAGEEYLYLDAVDNQYTVLKGSIEDYVDSQVDSADALGVGLIWGLNIADGGDGTSNQPGWSSGKWAMSADEIVDYGAYILTNDNGNALMFLNWEYDCTEVRSGDGTTIGCDYFNEPELQEALADLGEIATQY